MTFLMIPPSTLALLQVKVELFLINYQILKFFFNVRIMQKKINLVKEKVGNAETDRNWFAAVKTSHLTGVWRLEK